MPTVAECVLHATVHRLHQGFQNVTLLTVLNLCTTIRQVQPDLCHVLYCTKTQMFSGITLKSLLLNFTQVGQKMWKVHVESHLCL